MQAGEVSQTVSVKQADAGTPLKHPQQTSKRRPDSASPGSGPDSGRRKGKYTFKRDRRHRDAPGGTRNIQKIYRWEGGQRTSKFRALLPLANNMDPYILGDFKELQDALQTADRAVLAFYGRGHPLGDTNLPQELYEVEQLSGPDLAGFLLALEPQGWVRSKAIIDRAAKSQAEGTANAAKLPGASGADRDDDEAAEGESAEVRRAPLPKEAAQPSIKEAAQHQAQRLRELQSEHELAARLGSSSEAPRVNLDSVRPVNVFEADRPQEAGPDTRADRTGFAWADRWASRFAEPHNYGADLRHIARCRAAGISVEVKMREDMSCSRCGMTGHNARSLACPLRAFTGEPSAAPQLAAPGNTGPLPAWRGKISPQMEGVLRAVRRCTGECLDIPEMSLFQPLTESLSPDALLAVGCLLEARLLADVAQAPIDAS